MCAVLTQTFWTQTFWHRSEAQRRIMQSASDPLQPTLLAEGRRVRYCATFAT